MSGRGTWPVSRALPQGAVPSDGFGTDGIAPLDRFADDEIPVPGGLSLAEPRGCYAAWRSELIQQGDDWSVISWQDLPLRYVKISGQRVIDRRQDVRLPDTVAA
jgi:hypothetical protein